MANILGSYPNALGSSPSFATKRLIYPLRIYIWNSSIKTMLVSLVFQFVMIGWNKPIENYIVCTQYQEYLRKSLFETTNTNISLALL